MIEYENLAKLNSEFLGKLKEEAIDCLESGWYILGKKVQNFEDEFAVYNGSKYCIGLGSGLDALILGLESLNLPPDSEVLVPSNTYIATILAIIRCGLKPILVEPNIETYNMDATIIENSITKNSRVILPVHLYGKSCDMKIIGELAEAHNLVILEDAAQAHGAKFNNKNCGTFGKIGAFSFYPTKNLGALGDAGAILTDDHEIYERIKVLRNYGQQKKYVNEYLGYNSRLDEIQAGFLSVKLKFLDKINDHKRSLAKIYLEELDQSKFTLPVVDDNYFDIYHIFNIRHTERDQLQKYLLENKIQTNIHYPVSPHKQKALQNIFSGKNFPISEEIHQTTLSLPISYFHSEEDVKTVVEVLNRF